MPGIRLFSRRFNFSSDDLTIPSLIDIILRLPLVLIFIIFRLRDPITNSICLSSFYITNFYPFLTIYIIIIINASFICYISLQGTPVNNIRPRRYMSILIYIRLILVLIDIGIHILGLIILIRVFQTCDYIFRGVIITSIVISYSLSITLFLILIFFIDLTGVISAEKKWEMRIKFIFCCGRDYGNSIENFFLLLNIYFRWTII